MGVEIIVHQGASEIGGNCIEVGNEQARIILDFGTPFWFDEERKNRKLRLDPRVLVKEKMLPSVSGLYRYNSDSGVPIVAVCLSHPHKDHYGHFRFLNPRIPILAALATKDILKCYWMFADKRDKEGFGKRIVGVSEIWRYKTDGVSIEVEFVPVDHSHIASYALFVTFNEKRIIYTGDIRFHGRRTELMKEFIRRAIAFQPDKLIIEGTNITNRAVQYDGPKSEDDVLQKMKDIMRDAVGDVYVCTSSTHVDRVAVICEAAKAAGLTVVMSASTGAILRSAASYFSGLPHLDQEKVRVYYNEDEHNRATVTNRGKKQTLISRIFNKGYAVTSNSLPGERIVFVGNARAIEFFPRFRDNSTAIFSLYSGYLEDGSFGESFRRTMEERGVPVELCHTSGHARREDLINAILAIRPKVVFPVHTEHPEDFEDERLRTAGIRLLNYGAKVTN